MRPLFPILFAAALCAASVVQAEAPANVVTVHDPAGLMRAIATARPPERILLAPGDYGAIKIVNGPRLAAVFAAPLTIASADPTNPAQLSRLTIAGARNIAIEGLKLVYGFQSGDPYWTTPFAVINSRDITLRHNRFVGDVARGVSAVADGHGYGMGLSVRGSDGVAVRDNDISRFMVGIRVMESANIDVTGNDIHNLRMDGMDVSQVSHIRIADNHIHAFEKAPGSKDHPDMIQFWTAGTKHPTTDVTIENNLLDAEGDGWTQSIFMRNELVDTHKAGPEMFYRNVVIRQNVIINAHLHGILVGEGNGITISHNTLVHDARSDGPQANPPLWRPRIEVAKRSTDVTIEGNIAAAFPEPQPGQNWSARDNVVAQDRDPQAPGYYGQIFVNAMAGDPRDLRNFAYRKGGPADGHRIGAAALIDPK
ncbi:MAG: right-handed parallel beta-helix repeat-containing protein [Paracoccaceae bacterium]|nr:right-handed parallel beta-helix repeat-containing protein [Paracoccaceae bacterium]